MLAILRGVSEGSLKKRGNDQSEKLLRSKGAIVIKMVWRSMVDANGDLYRWMADETNECRGVSREAMSAFMVNGCSKWALSSQGQ